MSLSLVGPRYRNRVQNLPEHARQFDLATASGRCALECIAAGVGLLVADPKSLLWGLGRHDRQEAASRAQRTAADIDTGIGHFETLYRGLLSEAARAA